MDLAPPILPLPADAVAQIKSSIALTSLNAVAIELLKNSLDARSKRVEVAVDYCRGNCVVEDDGLGISPLEFKEGGGLGKLHHSSKHSGTVITYGSRGAFLASVAALSLVSITSHHHLYHSHNTLTINRSHVIAREIPSPPHQIIHGHKHGTRVAVRDLFGNMPVRVKQRVDESRKLSGSGREWEELRKSITSLALVWPTPVLILVRDGVTGQKLQWKGANSSTFGNIQSRRDFLTHVCNTLSQSMFISSPDQSNWVSVRASTPRISIRGAISQEPSPTKGVQFLSLGIEPLSMQNGYRILYDEINRVFENSSFGSEDASSGPSYTQSQGKHECQEPNGDNFTSKELRGSKKGFDRWPMFSIQVEFRDPITQEVEPATSDDIVEDNSGSLNSLVELLKALVWQFLKSHKFGPRLTQPIHVFQNGKSESQRNILEEGLKAEHGHQRQLHPHKQLQARRVESPFKEWSRVKSGRPNLPNDFPEKLSQLNSQNSNRGTETLSPLANSPNTDLCLRSDSHISSPSLRSESTTIAASGKVIRPPFDDLSLRAVGMAPTPLPVEHDVSVPEWDERPGEEKLLNWINPITRMGSLVNSRTGFVTKSSNTERLTPRISSYLKPNSQENLLTDRVTASKYLEPKEKSNVWIDDILRNWDNPIYCPIASSIPQVSINVPGSDLKQLLRSHQHECTQFDITHAFQETSAGLHGRISKEALRNADVISQVDGKFILVKISANGMSSDDGNTYAAPEMLALVDQHAADERCRIEKLLDELCRVPLIDEHTAHVVSLQPGVLTKLLDKPICFIMPGREIRLLQTHARHLANWGILYDIRDENTTTNQHHEHKVVVKSLPPLIAERCIAVPKLLAELIRSEIWKYAEKGSTLPSIDKPDVMEIDTDHPWLRKIHSCPQALLEMLNSRACRSAVMFNDKLSNSQCKALISRLAECAFPFQCAHGRPSMIPLLNLDSFNRETVHSEGMGLRCEASFGGAFAKWKQSMASSTQP